MSSELKPETPVMKKQNSYTYWVDNNNKSRQLPPEHQPKKLQGPILNSQNDQGPSAWNAIGTWEEKKISFSQLQNEVCKTLKQLPGLLQNNIQIVSVKLEGEAYKVYKKNKWNVIYEIKGQAELKKNEQKGKFKYIQLSNMGDRQYQISGSVEIRKFLEGNAQFFIKAIQNQLSKHNN